MTSLLDILNQGWFGIIAGAAVGWLLYHRGKRDPHLSYRQTTQTLIARVPQSLISRVSINFDGKPTDDLLSTRLVIWNAGSAAIRSDSFPQGGGLAIAPQKMTAIVGFEIAGISNPLNGVALKESSGHISVDLNYLNPGDGLIVDILHRSEAGKFKVTGILLGHRKGVTYEGNVDQEVLTRGSFWTRTKSTLENIFMAVFSVFVVYVGYLYWLAYQGGDIVSKSMTPEQHLYGAIFMMPIGLLGFIAALISLLKPTRHPPTFSMDDMKS